VFGRSLQVRILLVEDNPADVFLIKEALKTHGIDFDLTWVSDGEEAVSRVEEIRSDHSAPQLILLDLNLPKLDGKQVLSRIRRNPALAGTPVAILTSSDSPHDRRDTASLGANCYIRKPPTLDEFLGVGETIRDLLFGNPVP
jgi:chemotaxis family two-component system response regulator Rcp1